MTVSTLYPCITDQRLYLHCIRALQISDYIYAYIHALQIGDCIYMYIHTIYVGYNVPTKTHGVPREKSKLRNLQRCTILCVDRSVSGTEPSCSKEAAASGSLRPLQICTGAESSPVAEAKRQHRVQKELLGGGWMGGQTADLDKQVASRQGWMKPS